MDRSAFLNSTCWLYGGPEARKALVGGLYHTTVPGGGVTMETGVWAREFSSGKAVTGIITNPPWAVTTLVLELLIKH